VRPSCLTESLDDGFCFCRRGSYARCHDRDVVLDHVCEQSAQVDHVVLTYLSQQIMTLTLMQAQASNMLLGKELGGEW
jgi:hypothetical protein